MDGKLIFAVGKSTYYYFLVTMVDYNWHANQKTVQQITDSLKIDQ